MFFRGASAFESDKAETLTPSFNAYTYTAGLHLAALPSLDSDFETIREFTHRTTFNIVPTGGSSICYSNQIRLALATESISRDMQQDRSLLLTTPRRKTTFQ
jgi:hypothetical protein